MALRLPGRLCAAVGALWVSMSTPAKALFSMEVRQMSFKRVDQANASKGNIFRKASGSSLVQIGALRSESIDPAETSSLSSSFEAGCKHVKVKSAGKLNGDMAEFWLADERIDMSPSKRGLNLVTIDLHTQKPQSKTNYDLYADPGGAKESLAADIEEMKPGTAVLMGVMDTGLESLDSSILQLFEDAFGAKIAKLPFREGYVLIAIKNGGAVIAENQGPSAEASAQLPCHRTFTTPNPENAMWVSFKRANPENANALDPSLLAASNGCMPFKVRVLSAGNGHGNVANFYVNGKQLRTHNASSRGINIVTLDPRNGKMLSKTAYDVWEQLDAANEKLFDDLEKIPVGTVVLAAAMDSGMENLDSYALDALQTCGASITKGEFRVGYALIGVKGGKAIAEKMGPSVEINGVPACPDANYTKKPIDKSAGESTPGSDEVLFAVVSDSDFYQTRVAWLLDTWGRDVPKGDLMIVADKKTKEQLPAKVVETDCQKGTHDSGCCKYGHAVYSALQHLKADPKKEWFYFTDDDVYVRPEHMKQRLSKRRITKWPVAKGLLGCSNDKCDGICGGGGFLLNKEGLLKLVANDTREQFVESYMKACAYCSNFGDLAVSKLIKERGVKLENMKGLHPWRLEKLKFIDEMRSAYDPIALHYMTNNAQLQFLYKMFSSSMKRNVDPKMIGKVDTDPKYPCINYQGVHICANSSSTVDLPYL